ncbi:MAG: hypothetical protein AB7I32_19555 [Gammaproteobacteria bacterium]
MTAKTGSTHARGATPDRSHPEEPAAAPLGTDDEAAGATGARHPAREARSAPKSRSPLMSTARWRQFGAALLLVLLIVAVFAVPVLLR